MPRAGAAGSAVMHDMRLTLKTKAGRPGQAVPRIDGELSLFLPLLQQPRG